MAKLKISQTPSSKIKQRPARPKSKNTYWEEQQEMHRRNVREAEAWKKWKKGFTRN